MNLIEKIKFKFEPDDYGLLTEGNCIVDVYSDKLKLKITEGTIRINTIYKKRETASIYALQMSITRLNEGDTNFKFVAKSEIFKVDTILESRKDFYNIPDFIFTTTYASKYNLKNSRITLTIFEKKGPYSSKWYAHSKSNLFDF